MSEKERFERRMYEKHGAAPRIMGITLKPGIELSEDDIYRELNRLEDLVEQGQVTTVDVFDDITPTKSDLISERTT